MGHDKMEHVRKVILDTIPEGVLKKLAEKNLILVPPQYEDDVFSVAAVILDLPNLTLKAERFVDTDHWWIGTEMYTYYSPAELDVKLSDEISKSIEWITI